MPSPQQVVFVQTFMPYSGGQKNGMIVIVLCSFLSLIAEFGLLVALLVAIVRPKFKDTTEALFLKSNFGTYFISLLVANAIASLGSILNVHWINNGGVVAGELCTAQGSIKNIGNVATALWVLVIAFHVFNLLFLRTQTSRKVALATTVGIWSFTCALDIFGPAVLRKNNLGPFFGIAGYWCWISDSYPGARVGLEYFWFFFSGATSFVLYTLVYFRLRGNIYVPEGERLPRFSWTSRAQAWKLQARRDVVDAYMTTVARKMILFPVAYTIVIIPIAVDRFYSNGGAAAPFGAVAFADSLFMLFGFINVVVFLFQRRNLPKASVLPTFNIPRKPPPAFLVTPPQATADQEINTGGSDRSFGTKDRNDLTWDSVIVQEEAIVTNLAIRGHRREASRSSIEPDEKLKSLAPVLTIRNNASRDEVDLASRPLHVMNDSLRASHDDPFSDAATVRDHEGQEVYFRRSGSFDSEVTRTNRNSKVSEWAPSYSAYFEDVDLKSPNQIAAARQRLSQAYQHPVSDIPPVPRLNDVRNRI